MRRHAMLSMLLLGFVAAGGAQASANHADHSACSFSSDYDVHVKPNGIDFTRDSVSPSDVFMHDGQLRVDGRNVAVSAADAARLRDFEQQVRELLPEMASIARDGVDVGYSALTTVAATLADNGDERTRILQALRDKHIAAMRRIDGGLGSGVWSADDNGDAFGRNMQAMLGDLVGDVTRDLVKDVLSGDPGKMAALQARTDALDTNIDKAVDGPADKLEQRARALCPRLGELDNLQRQFQFRLAGGERLQLISIDKDRSNKAGQYADRY